jgi:hypothetical protein
MMKQLMFGSAAAALIVSGAFAQSPNPTPPSASTPPAAAAIQPGNGTPQFVDKQQPDQWLASRFKGTDVIGKDDKKIGDVTDVLFDKTGKIEAFVVSVGGFLGMGAKDVALAPTSFEVVPGKDGGSDKLKLSLSQDELKQAQNFTPYSPPRATTTGSGASSPLSSPGGMKPMGK